MAAKEAAFFMLNEKSDSDELIDFVVEFEPPDNWEQIRDEEGKVMEGCYRTLPATMSDEL